MDKLKDRAFNANYMILITIFIISALGNVDNPFMLMFLNSMLIFSICIKDIYFFREDNHKKWLLLWLLGDIVFSIFINCSYNGVVLKLYYFSIIFLINMYYTNLAALIFTVIIAVSDGIFVGVYKNHQNFGEFINWLIIYVVFFLLLYILRQAIEQNDKINEIKESLLMKTVDGVNYNRKLTKAYDKVEELTRVNERISISREIHDTVGHTLTTALAELQAGLLVVDGDLNGGKQKISEGTEQVRKALREMRKAVRSYSDEERCNYYDELFLLIEETKKLCDLKVIASIEDFSRESKIIQKTVYRVIQEAFTNGVKHGKASSFIITVKYVHEVLNLFIGNNGEGISVINKGFGLSSMEERVKIASGEISFESCKGEGFNIYVKFKASENK